MWKVQKISLEQLSDRLKVCILMSIWIRNWTMFCVWIRLCTGFIYSTIWFKYRIWLQIHIGNSNTVCIWRQMWIWIQLWIWIQIMYFVWIWNQLWIRISDIDLDSRYRFRFRLVDGFRFGCELIKYPISIDFYGFRFRYSFEFQMWI